MQDPYSASRLPPGSALLPVSWHCLSTAPTLLLNPTKFSLAKICQSHPTPSPNLRQRHLCQHRAQNPWVGSLIFLLPRPADSAPKVFLSPPPALAVLTPPQSYRRIVPKLHLIV